MTSMTSMTSMSTWHRVAYFELPLEHWSPRLSVSSPKTMYAWTSDSHQPKVRWIFRQQEFLDPYLDPGDQVTRRSWYCLVDIGASSTVLPPCHSVHLSFWWHSNTDGLKQSTSSDHSSPLFTGRTWTLIVTDNSTTVFYSTSWATHQAYRGRFYLFNCIG